MQSALAVVFALTFCLALPVFSASEVTADIPAPAKTVLAKASKLINDKEYGKAAQMILEFQGNAPPPGARVGNDKGWFHSEVHHALGVCHLFQEHYGEAAKALQRAVDSNPRHQSALLNLGKAHYELGNYDQAAACYLGAYQASEEKKPEYLYFAAVARLLAKQYGQAIPFFEQLLAEHRGAMQPEWRENLVHALLGAGENRRAIEHLEALSDNSHGKNQRQWQELLLQQYLQLQMRDKALAFAEKLLAKAPAEVIWWRALAHLHLQQNRYQEALTCLLIAGYLEPPSKEEQRLTADLYLQLGTPAQAVPLYRELIGEHTNPQLLANLLVALQQLGETEEALRTLETFAPASLTPELAMTKADLLFSLGRYREAATLCDQSAASVSGKQRHRLLQMAEYAKTRLVNGSRDG